MFACKAHIPKVERENHLEAFRIRLNKAIADRLDKNPNELKVFCVLEVSNRFNAKLNTSYREYSYYLPTYVLSSIYKHYLGKKGTDLQPEEQVKPKEEDITAVKVVNGITITRRFQNEGDEFDVQDKHLGRNITHLTENPDLM